MAGKQEEERTKEKPFDLEDWLREGMRGLRHSLRIKRPGPLMPEQFKSHTRAARREMLLAVRSLLDAAIEELAEEVEAPKAAK